MYVVAPRDSFNMSSPTTYLTYLWVWDHILEVIANPSTFKNLWVDGYMDFILSLTRAQMQFYIVVLTNIFF